MPRLTKYWITFEAIAKPDALSLGCGVTARSEVDALQLLERFSTGLNREGFPNHRNSDS
jgi:hypothetical protein